MSFVLDASIALAWCFADESTPTSIYLLNQLETENAYVPAIWSLELGNILVGAAMKKRISRSHVIQFLDLINELNIKVDTETDKHALHDTLDLAFAENLTTYDASYLELSIRLGLPLATKDRQLITAAQHLNLEVLS